jgi:hypothetical protein
MHKENISGMSHEGFFLSGTQRNLAFGKFSWMLRFKNTSNANLIDVFYR